MATATQSPVPPVSARHRAAQLAALVTVVLWVSARPTRRLLAGGAVSFAGMGLIAIGTSRHGIGAVGGLSQRRRTSCRRSW
jgi:hypothetical protein